jgi:hypothetical protein
VWHSLTEGAPDVFLAECLFERLVRIRRHIPVVSSGVGTRGPRWLPIERFALGVHERAIRVDVDLVERDTLIDLSGSHQ